ncbi:unnamed protein product, partial [Mesorhabditis spiculigera]
MSATLLRSGRLTVTCFMRKAGLHLSARANGERRYTKKHEWVLVENGIGTVGITEFAASALGDIVFVELPEIDKEFGKGDSIGAIESVKAASDIYTPIAGTVVERNTQLEDTPNTINKSPLGDGWIAKLRVKDDGELQQLLTEAEYNKFKEEEEGAH